jgi:hypothetical protein
MPERNWASRHLAEQSQTSQFGQGSGRLHQQSSSEATSLPATAGTFQPDGSADGSEGRERVYGAIRWRLT